MTRIVRKFSMKKTLPVQLALMSAALLGYGRRAYALCTGTAATYTCSGATNTAQTITANNANVTLTSDFNLAPPLLTPISLSITGNGHLRLNFQSGSQVSNTHPSGFVAWLDVTGNDGATSGAITVTGDINIPATASFGAYFRNQGSGDTSVDLNGSINVSFDGLVVTNASSGRHLSVTTGATIGTVALRPNYGVLANNQGQGDTNVTVSGALFSALRAIHAYTVPSAGSVNVVTGASSFLTSSGQGISAYHRGSGALVVTANGTISSDDDGIRVRNTSAVASTITVNGSVSSNTDYALRVDNVSTGAAPVTITTASTSSLSGRHGIRATSAGTSGISLTANGSVTATNGRGIFTRSPGGSTSIAVNQAISAQGASGFGIYALNQAGSQNLNITVGSAGSIVSDEKGIYARNLGSGNSSISVSGAVQGTGSQGIYLFSSQDNAIDVVGTTVAGTIGIQSQSGTQLALTLDGRSSAVTITGSGGYAIGLAAPSNALTLRGTVNLNGHVLVDHTVGTGPDALHLDNSSVTLGAGNAIIGKFTVDLTGTNHLSGHLNASGEDIATSSTSAGSLHLNGQLTADSFTVADRTTFGGNNTVTGNLILGSGGHLAPGNSVGTVNTTGNVTFNSGSYFDFEVSGFTADLLAVTGSVTIQSGAVLNLMPLSTFNGSSGTLITATGGITGNFGTVNYNGPNAMTLYASGAGSLSFIALNTTSFSSQAQSAVDGGMLFGESLGEHALPWTESTEAAPGKRYWTQALYRHNDVDAADGFYGYASEAYGVAAGAEFDLGKQFKLGFALADIAGESKLEQGLGRGTSNGVMGAVYATGLKPMGDGMGFATVGVLAGARDTDGRRTVSNAGTPSDATFSAKGAGVGAILQLGMKLPLWSDWSLMGRVGLTYLHTRTGGYTEAGGGTAGVSVDDYHFDSARFAQSLRLSKRQGIPLWGSSLLHPYAEVGLAQERAVGDRNLSGRFSTGTAFTTTLDDRHQSFISASVGANLELSGKVRLFAHYQHAKSGEHTRDEARVGVNVEF